MPNSEITSSVDVVIYSGDVTYSGYMQLSDDIERFGNKEAQEVFFIPITNGGDPNAGYRIARALGHYYPKTVRIGIPSICKSAGTLMCIGGSELVVADRAELGPLDIQLNSKDELFGLSSGLDIMQALNALQDTMNSAFKSYLYDLKFGGRLGTKMASDIASNMAVGLVAPIAQQIDPVKLGEHQRAMQIAIAYGERLNAKFKNTSRENIERLLTSYPAHGFVIDRKEVCELFTNVRSPNGAESTIFRLLKIFGIEFPGSTPTTFVSDFQKILESSEQHLKEKNSLPEVDDGSHTGPTGNVDNPTTVGEAAASTTRRPQRKGRDQSSSEPHISDPNGAN